MKHNERLKIQVETGVSLPTITKWDKGQRCNPTLAATIAKAAKKNGFSRLFSQEWQTSERDDDTAGDLIDCQGKAGV